MNRRLRRPSPHSLSPEERYLRYLKPGALAQLRDFKISARSHRSTDYSHFQHQIPLSRTPSPPSPSQIDGHHCFFSARVHGPRFPQRKRLVAARPVFFNPSSPASNPPDSVIDLFSSSNDLLVAH
ncbi:hypothetical protein RHGRI_017907 [Rhododendron griersonianum]|uniref:Uncharacterized protein n=1 Tax=Rhododendron griersonianum TaxID=479676 RepID=A0AAV6JZI0_9ERIC|nr:hypothetical protein RHGRI_017907 [Rhododendron griersonianum]